MADRVMLWTRLAPSPIELGGGITEDKVDVIWEVADDDRFTRMIASGVHTAEARHGHSVHVDAVGLDPASDVYYRFRVGDWTSATGRTRTLPDGSIDAFRLAVANCQMRETGRWAAFRHMAEQDLDLVVHLGDYIYEYPGVAEAGSFPAHQLVSLDDYRLRYSSYKVDPALQAAHHRFPWVVMWDDHEVANNYSAGLVPGALDVPAADHMAAAFQAWWEFMPVRLDPPDGAATLDIYQSLEIGDLARLYLLDERQYSDVPPCRPDPENTLDYGDCDARTAEDRTRLGADQKTWLDTELARGGVSWNLVGNPVVLSGVDTGAADAEAAYWLETWDGYPQARQRVVDALAQVDNPLVLTGDYHQGMVLGLHRTPFDTTSELVATEFMAPPISSRLFSTDASPRTPQLREQIDRHGYMTVEVTPDRLTAHFEVVGDVADPDSPVTTLSTWTVDAGNPLATRA